MNPLRGKGSAMEGAWAPRSKGIATLPSEGVPQASRRGTGFVAGMTN